MRLSRSFGLALGLALPVLCAATGCASVEETEDDAPADSSSSDALTQSQCREVNRAYGRCMQDETASYRSCVRSAENDLLEGYVDTVLGGVLGTVPCVGPALSSALATKCFTNFDADPVGCLAGALQSILEDTKMVQNFTKCAEKTGKAMAQEVGATAKSNVYTALAFLAAHTTKFVRAYQTCGETYASGNEGCEPVACNANRILCFDAPSCPTVSACKGGPTHITGIFPAEMVRGGYVVGDNGARIARCVSKKSMGGAYANVCQGDKSVPLVKACTMHAK
jgi:hypothetical protein